MLRSNKLGVPAPTIGVLADWLGDAYHVAVLKGLLEAASSAGVNLLCFVGGELPVDAETSDARHRIYDLADARCVDGLVLVGSALSDEVGVDGLTRHCRRYRSLPVISVGIDLQGFPSVTVDNQAGMRAVVTHLLEVHGARRLACVRGPLNNPEAELRVAAFREALALHGRVADESLIVTGNFL